MNRLFLTLLLYTIVADSDSSAAGPRIYFTAGAGLNVTVDSIDSNGTNFSSFPSPVTSPRGFAIHAERQELYIAGRTPTDSFAVFRMNVDGSNPLKILTGAGTDLALDPVNDKLYWTTSQQIIRSNLDGTNIETVLGRVDPGYEIDNIAVDGTNGFIYWTEQHTLYRTDLVGGDRILYETGPEIGFNDIGASSIDGTFCYTFGGVNDEFVLFRGYIQCYGSDRSLGPGVDGGPDVDLFFPGAVAVGSVNHTYWHNFDGIETFGQANANYFPARVVYDPSTGGAFLAVDMNVIPEPSSFALAIGAAAAFFLFFRIRGGSRFRSLFG